MNNFTKISNMYCGAVIFFSLYTLKMILADQSLLYMDEIRSLSELPMEKLLQIKSAFGNGKLIAPYVYLLINSLL